MKGSVIAAINESKVMILIERDIFVELDKFVLYDKKILSIMFFYFYYYISS